MVLAIGAPRQVLSRHFHNPYEQIDYVMLQHKQRTRYWSSISPSILQHETLDSLSRHDTIMLALSMGVGSTLPEPLAYLTAAVSKSYCRQQVRYILQTISEDDDCILEEMSGGEDEQYFANWSDIELLDACYLRGLMERDEVSIPSRPYMIHLLHQHLTANRKSQHLSGQSRELRLWYSNVVRDSAMTKTPA